MRLTVLLTVVLAVVAWGTPANASTVHFEGTNGRAQVEPRTLWLTGDGTLNVFYVRWSSWGDRTATGVGTAKWHGCLPDCAEARRHDVRVRVRLSYLVFCSGALYYALYYAVVTAVPTWACVAPLPAGP